MRWELCLVKRFLAARKRCCWFIVRSFLFVPKCTNAPLQSFDGYFWGVLVLVLVANLCSITRTSSVVNTVAHLSPGRGRLSCNSSNTYFRLLYHVLRSTHCFICYLNPPYNVQVTGTAVLPLLLYHWLLYFSPSIVRAVYFSVCGRNTVAVLPFYCNVREKNNTCNFDKFTSSQPKPLNTPCLACFLWCRFMGFLCTSSLSCRFLDYMLKEVYPARGSGMFLPWSRSVFCTTSPSRLVYQFHNNIIQYNTYIHMSEYYRIG